ncbi:MAG: response regulator, partial [Chitinophagaceae bacterium]|nr:response regulator [Chitinophagaceae bacterium]
MKNNNPKAMVLLVEDESSLREALKLNLELEGYEVRAVDNGKKALQAFKEEYFDCIILDIMMPELDGLMVSESIRLQNQNIPILFLSARNTSADRVAGLRMGGDDYMTKPFNLEELLLRVDKL